MAFSRRRVLTALTTGVLAFAPLATAHAQTSDAANDFLPTYVGPQNGDMDVRSVQVFFDGTAFRFTSTHGGAIGTTAGSFFVWGMNRGQGTARFAAIAPGVLFDWVLSITPGGATTVRDLLTNVSTTIDPSAVTILGSTISALIPASLLPSTGFAMSDYTANLWPRVPGAGTTGISDFAPDNSNIRVTVTPEPASVLLFGLGSMGVLAIARRRRAR